jgi:DNA polymerase-3 subunit epsilon
MKYFPHSRFIVLDVETTGLSPINGDRIIEIGALAIERRIIKEEFHTLINIDRAIPRQAQEIHGITQAMLTGKPKPEEVMPEFAEFIRDSVLIAHNAKFDMGFIRHEFIRQRISFNHPYICTLEMSQGRLPHLPNHKLGTVYRHLIGKPTTEIQEHRALGDAHMVAAIWLAMEGG